MLELPELTPEHFEILVMRELRKIGLGVSELRTHRRSMLPEPERGYLLELKGVLRRTDWQRRTLIACRRQQRPIGSVEVESLKEHLKEAEVEAGVLFGAADFDPGGWGAPGHYPAWLPAYCAQSVARDPLGQLRYQLLESGQAGAIVDRLRTPTKERREA